MLIHKLNLFTRDTRQQIAIKRKTKQRINTHVHIHNNIRTSTHIYRKTDLQEICVTEILSLFKTFCNCAESCYVPPNSDVRKVPMLTPLTIRYCAGVSSNDKPNVKKIVQFAAKCHYSTVAMIRCPLRC